MNKRNVKILRHYAISLLCIAFYFFLENSNIIPELVQKSERCRYGSFPTFYVTGLLKYGLFFVGIGILIILSFLLIKQKISEKRIKDSQGNIIIQEGDETYSIPNTYKKTGTSYKIFLRNETDKSVNINNKIIFES